MSIKAATESDVVRACLDYLTIRGVWAWRQNQGAIPLPGGKGFRRFVGVRGQADVIGVLPGGRFLAVECKRPGGRLSPAQREFLDDVRRSGGAACVAASVTELARFLDEEGV